MCDYSLTNVKSRAARVGDRLVVRDFGMGTRGFAGVEDEGVAVCVLPGTEIGFAEEVRSRPMYLFSLDGMAVEDVRASRVALFRQVNKDEPHRHHDALEFPDGTVVLLTNLTPGQAATVLQLPAIPKTAEEAKEQERLAIVA